MSRFEPFDFIAIILAISSVGLLFIGALTNNPDLSESARFVIVSIISAYVGKRFMTGGGPPTDSGVGEKRGER